VPGYSGAPLAKKLGIKAGSRVLVVNAPPGYEALLAPMPEAVRFDALLHESTDIVEDTIRKLALPLGFVDVKVCAVSEVGSGLKLVVRKELR
jgi:hypothetical protein